MSSTSLLVPKQKLVPVSTCFQEPKCWLVGQVIGPLPNHTLVCPLPVILSTSCCQTPAPPHHWSGLSGNLQRQRFSTTQFDLMGNEPSLLRKQAFTLATSKEMSGKKKRVKTPVYIPRSHHMQYICSSDPFVHRICSNFQNGTTNLFSRTLFPFFPHTIMVIQKHLCL